MKIYQHYSIYGFSNGYIVGNEEKREALIVDPAEVTTTMIDQIENKRYILKAILITHNHIHHVRGLKTLMKIYSPELYASDNKIFGFPCRKVRDGDVFEEAGFSVKAVAIPGHSQDSIVYIIGSALFSGDAIHSGVIGKTTSTFNAVALAQRLRARLDALPASMLIFPGHGPPSTVGTERKFNIGLMPGYAESLNSSYDFFV